MKLNWMSGQVAKYHKQSDKAHGLLVTCTIWSKYVSHIQFNSCLSRNWNMVDLGLTNMAFDVTTAINFHLDIRESKAKWGQFELPGGAGGLHIHNGYVFLRGCVETPGRQSGGFPPKDICIFKHKQSYCHGAGVRRPSVRSSSVNSSFSETAAWIQAKFCG